MSTQLTSKQIVSMDKRGRMSFPAVFRGLLGDSIYLTQDIDDKGCVVAYSKEGFDAFCETMCEGMSPYDVSMMMTVIGDVTHIVDPDTMGRITLPEELRTFASMTSGTVVVVGAGKGVEIWEKERYDAFISEKSAGIRAMMLAKRKQMHASTEE